MEPRQAAQSVRCAPDPALLVPALRHHQITQISCCRDERPRHALRRLADIGCEGLPFIGGLLSDYMLPAYKVDIGLRAQELRSLLTRLG